MIKVSGGATDLLPTWTEGSISHLYSIPPKGGTTNGADWNPVNLSAKLASQREHGHEVNEVDAGTILSEFDCDIPERQ